MLQQDKAQDYVIATNKENTVRECVEIAFDEAGVPDWEKHVRIDPQFLRPAEVDHLIGDPTKAKIDLGWEPRTSFEELIRLMTRRRPRAARALSAQTVIATHATARAAAARSSTGLGSVV